MRHYLDYYWDIYWDLHLGVKGDAVPPQVRAIGEAFNTVLAFRNPLQEIVYENYMTVRALRPFLAKWIDARLDDIANGRVSDPDKTIAYYWLRNAGDGKYFAKKDVVFECFHNFVALSQWGNSIFGIMTRLNQNGGDQAVRAAFQKTMSGDFDNANGAPYTPLELLVMELFRTISPNGGSISAITDTRASSFYGGSPFAQFGVPYERHSYMNTPHTETSFDPRLWKEPERFDPERYLSVPTSAQIDEAKCKQIGLPRCPFDITTLPVSDGRKTGITNSGFGTVFAVSEGKPAPVCDYAGFAPFGFGYRRCPGEQLTIDVFADFLRKVWRDKIVFHNLNQPRPGRVPGWAGRGDRRRHRVLEVCVARLIEPRARPCVGAIAGKRDAGGKHAYGEAIGGRWYAWESLRSACPGATAHAGSARDYLNAPVDTWLLNYNAGYTTSVTPEDGTDTVPGVRSNVLAQSIVLTRIMDYWGRTGGFSLVLPYALIDTSAGPFRASTNGVSDVGFLWQMNIFGGPALTREQFQFFIPQTFSSFHLLVTTPLGTYNPTSPINPSANRWMISPTVNFSYTPDQGWTWIETYVSGRIFSDNRNYLVNGAQTLSQKPILRLEEHLSRNVTDALWLSADAYYNLGGETSIDGIEQDNMANTLRIGGGNGTAPVAWRRSRAELRTRRRQTSERALFANRATYREATVVRACCFRRGFRHAN